MAGGIPAVRSLGDPMHVISGTSPCQTNYGTHQSHAITLSHHSSLCLPDSDLNWKNADCTAVAGTLEGTGRGILVTSLARFNATKAWTVYRVPSVDTVMQRRSSGKAEILRKDDPYPGHHSEVLCMIVISVTMRRIANTLARAAAFRMTSY